MSDADLADRDVIDVATEIDDRDRVMRIVMARCGDVLSEADIAEAFALPTESEPDPGEIGGNTNCSHARRWTAQTLNGISWIFCKAKPVFPPVFRACWLSGASGAARVRRTSGPPGSPRKTT
jgi:hypothetical protein